MIVIGCDFEEKLRLKMFEWKSYNATLGKEVLGEIKNMKNNQRGGGTK